MEDPQQDSPVRESSSKLQCSCFLSPLFLLQISVISSPTWWWIGWAALAFAALVLNLLFLVIVIKNRKTRDFRSLLTATLVTISVLDILDITRIVPSIVTNLHEYAEFRIVYCSIGVFHTISVALLLLLAGKKISEGSGVN